MTKTQTLAGLALALPTLLASLAPASASAQGQARPLSIMVPQPAGNPTDGVARKIQPLLQAQLQRPVIVENQPGAGGSIGTQRLLNAPADGNMLLIASQTEPILTPFTLRHVKYSAKDMRAVALVARLPYILTGSTKLPARNLSELAAHTQAAGSQGLNFGHIGPGSMIHLLGEQWARQSGSGINHVVYRGVPPVVQDLMSGQIDLSFLPLGGATLQMIESGKVRAFATTGAQPSPALPQVPALAASDKKLADFVYGTWIAFLVPAKTPEATVARLNQAIVAAMQDDSFREYVSSTGMELVTANSLPDVAKFYDSETQLYEGLAKKIGVEPN
ncbi:tripartite tricarboxylate transporter substrate binding protein [Pantoea sp. 18069]|uniref:Bug family tripartite tricarboxylate transporter substrate binding protein n=1 Tax=Pantoea sp. 18069 TaxID=2681415 RepID=UPI001358B616|nr:tripartite tricarboxylate transporter substrate binding protein [Pantoea sp. 18069]